MLPTKKNTNTRETENETMLCYSLGVENKEQPRRNNAKRCEKKVIASRWYKSIV